MAKSYQEKLRDPRWQKRRLEILQRDDWSCVNCGDTESTLHVHHMVYNGEPWEADDKHLYTLCGSCHETEEQERPKAEKELLNTLKLAGFFSHSIKEITEGFKNISTVVSPEITASVLKYALSSAPCMRFAEDKYFISIKKRLVSKSLIEITEDEIKGGGNG